MKDKKKKAKKLKHLPYYEFKNILNKKNVKQKDIAKLLDLSPVTISQKINGALDFFYSEIDTICDELQISSEIFRSNKVA